MSKIYKISKINPCITTENLGDNIIEWYCNDVCSELFGEHMSINVPTRERLSRETMKKISSSDYAFVFGTNLLSSDMKKNRQWNITYTDVMKFKFAQVKKKDILHLDYKAVLENINSGHIVLLGTGWLDYQMAATGYTKKMLKALLDKEIIHSVRDSYTEQHLKSIGINNVINTACPTMWNLSEKFCEDIPYEKADSVVTTITDYRMDAANDRLLIDILLKKYKIVYIWLQSLQDYKYLNSLEVGDSIKIIKPTLEAYDSFLRNNTVDYVGTRLHGGIRALNYKKRTCIIAVDNRAIEIANDTNLPIINRTDIGTELEKWIDSDSKIRIKLPTENIQIWKNQFKKIY